MEYLFSLICLGPSHLAIKYLTKGKMSPVESDNKSVKFNAVISSFSVDSNEKNNYNLEINVPLRSDINEQDLLSSDGILFFTNPTDEADYTVLKEQFAYISKLSREIPSIVIYYNPDGLITKPTNKILENIWKNTLYEAFICSKYSENKIQEILTVLCDAISSNSMILNPEFAWLRIPVLIEKANQLIFKQQYGIAAKYVELLSIIGRKFQMADYLIWIEQAAWLYLQAQEYIRAIDLLKTYNVKKAKIKQEEYVKVLVQQGNILYRAGNYLQAAQKYDFAAKWASFELNNPELYRKIARSVILAYISANAFDKAFGFLETFNNEEAREILKEIGPYVLKAVEYLVSMNKFDLAKMQIYLVISVYQRYSIFDYIPQISNILASVLYVLFDREISKDDPHSSRLILDEISNVWESFRVPKKNLDDLLIKLGQLFLNIRDYHMADRLYPYIEKKEKQKELEDLRMKHEELVKMNELHFKISTQKRIEEAMESYILEEETWLKKILGDLFLIIDKLNEMKQYQYSLDVLNQYTKAFRKYRKIFLKEQMVIKKWDTMLSNNMLNDFMKELAKEEQSFRISYLRKSKDAIIKSIHYHFVNSDQDFAFKVGSNIMSIYRADMMYEDAKDITKILVDRRADYLETKTAKKDELSISQSIEHIREITHICDSYLEGKYPNLDIPNKNISEFFLEKGNLIEARRYMEKIKDLKIKDKISDMIQEKEQESLGAITDIAKEKQILHVKLDHFSILRNLSITAKNEREASLKVRNTLKKIFENCLNHLLNKDLDKAAQEYFETAKKLIQLKRYEASSLSLSISFLLNLILKEYTRNDQYLKEFSVMIASLEKIYEEIFAYKLLRFSHDMLKAKMTNQFIESLKLFYALPLFEEEEILLKSIIDSDDFKTQIDVRDTSADSGKAKIAHLISKLKNIKSFIENRESIHAKNIMTLREYFTKGKFEELSHLYLKIVQENAKTREVASTALILARIILLKEKRANYEREFEKWIFKNEDIYNHLKKQPEQTLFDYLVPHFLENPNSEVVLLINKALIDNLPFFPFEEQFLQSIRNSGESAVRSADACIPPASSDSTSLINQRIAELEKKIKANTSIYSEMKESRNVMRAQYYTECIEFLMQKKFAECVEKYFNLSKRFIRRSNLELAALMIFLSGACLAKSGRSPQNIETEIEKQLDELGLMKSSIMEHEFYVLLKIYLELLSCNVHVKDKIGNILAELPFLEEETILI